MRNKKVLTVFLIIILISAAFPVFAAKNSGTLWDYSRISISGNYQWTFGDLRDDLPAGYGTAFAMDQLLDKRQIWMPGLRFEFGFIDFKKDDNEIGGLGMNAGLIWIFGIFQNSYLSFSVLPGVSMVAVKNGTADTVSNVFSTHGVLMYEYHFEKIFLFAGARSTYLDNESSPLTGVGLTAGFGYRI